MKIKITRRFFLTSSFTLAILNFFKDPFAFAKISEKGKLVKATVSIKPAVIASANGLKAVEKAYQVIISGGSPLDGVIAGVNIVEDDPEDTSVGYGGLPNEEGEVELDASVMDGKTARIGAVAALKYIKNPSKVARLVMENTDHALLVGEGALQFALSYGFEKMNLLTDKSRKEWLKWRAEHSKTDDWLDEEDKKTIDDLIMKRKEGGTINCCAIDAYRNLAGVTTTSGLAFKIPGRVGDSPIIGAGLYVDNEIGAAGSTGRGESVIKICGSHTIVEYMRKGASPTDACLEAVKRIIATTRDLRLLDDQNRPNFNVKFYALNKEGAHGGAAMFSGGQYALCDNKGPRLMDLAFVYAK